MIEENRLKAVERKRKREEDESMTNTKDKRKQNERVTEELQFKIEYAEDEVVQWGDQDIDGCLDDMDNMDEHINSQFNRKLD